MAFVDGKHVVRKISAAILSSAVEFDFERRIFLPANVQRAHIPAIFLGLCSQDRCNQSRFLQFYIVEPGVCRFFCRECTGLLSQNFAEERPRPACLPLVLVCAVDCP